MVEPFDLQRDGHALVCGASAGIGRAAALAIAELGVRVTVLARRVERLRALVGELEEAGARGSAYLVADLDDVDGLERHVGILLRHTGPVHVLVNNAGGPAPGPLLEASDEAFLAAFRRHVLAAQRLTRLLLPGMADAGYGRIVNIISTSVREPLPNLGVSNTIRGAMASWAKTLAGELPPGVTVNNLLPGFTDTERLRQLAASVAESQGTTPDAVYEQWRASVPEGRLAEPMEQGRVVKFLASPEAAYLRGVSVHVDGGRMHAI